MRSGRMIASALLALLLAGGPALSHQLNVFAFVEDGVIVVEAKFSNGRMAQEGLVTVYDASDSVVDQVALSENGTARLPLEAHEGGLTIEVTAGEGHSNYWILTPQDLARPSGGAEARP